MVGDRLTVTGLAAACLTLLAAGLPAARGDVLPTSSPTATQTATQTPTSTGSPGPGTAVTCRPVQGFTRLADGTLWRLHDDQVLTGTGTLVEAGLVGTGWGSFAWTGSGGDGVVYALTRAGQLRWYRYDAGTAAWVKGSGRVVGSGFIPGTRVLNIAVGANGWFYTVRADGRLALYRHTGRLTGEATWLNGTGYVLGRGWTGDELIAPQGDGTVYRQRGGDLIWFRHTDPAAGPVTWANGGRGIRVGTGWRYYDLQVLGAGVLLATSAPSGQVTVRRHLDPVGGAPGWAADGPAKYVARSDSYGVTVDPASCS